eukprot:TRINITY_DN2558_c0_g2_i1.p1 TRINITY_DN2558_c0_g2~~TRINITY_DN2558_c0_g2_i1.p1  ORF type:complete len:256 (+),score=89.34 TRINITY_DN2558_c0_g2_i1:18-785(+)
MKFNRLNEEFKEQRDLLEQISSRLKELELENNQLQTRLESEKYNADNALALLAQERSQHTKSVQERDERIQALHNEKMDLDKQIEKYAGDINSLETKNFVSQENENQLRYRENEANKKIEQLKISVSELEQSKQLVLSQKDELNFTVTHLNHQYSSAREMMEDLEERLREEKSLVVQYLRDLQTQKEAQQRKLDESESSSRDLPGEPLELAPVARGGEQGGMNYKLFGIPLVILLFPVGYTIMKRSSFGGVLSSK